MQVNVIFEEKCTQFDVQFENLQKVTEYIDADPYTGSYDVTPKVEEQELLTKKKLMTDNVRIRSIPIYEVSNQADGETVYIATEVKMYGD